jgi:hypothetical protein
MSVASSIHVFELLLVIEELIRHIEGLAHLLEKVGRSSCRHVH